MQHNVDDDDIELDWPINRFWTYPWENWDPPLRYKFGWPYRACDEWGRRTFCVGFWFLGALVFAYRTCWCLECHEGRTEMYLEQGPLILANRAQRLWEEQRFIYRGMPDSEENKHHGLH